jgi:hypothetical protein
MDLQSWQALQRATVAQAARVGVNQPSLIDSGLFTDPVTGLEMAGDLNDATVAAQRPYVDAVLQGKTPQPTFDPPLVFTNEHAENTRQTTRAALVEYFRRINQRR